MQMIQSNNSRKIKYWYLLNSLENQYNKMKIAAATTITVAIIINKVNKIVKFK